MTFRTEVAGPAGEELTPDWIFDQIQEWARRSPDRVAFVIDQKDKVEEYRYADVLDRADEFAAALISKGIQRGDHIGILMENVPQWVFALLGAMRIGAVTVPLATALPENSIQLIAEHAGCKLLIADETNWEKASRVAGALGCTLTRPFGPPSPGGRGTSDPPSPSGRGWREAPGEGTATALLIYTSGTTGSPKGVELTFDNLN